MRSLANVHLILNILYVIGVHDPMCILSYVPFIVSLDARAFIYTKEILDF